MDTEYRYYALKCWQPPGETAWGHHKTLGIVARDVEEAIGHAKRLHPDLRVDCINAGGQVNYFPGEEDAK